MDLGIEGKWALVCAASKGLGKGCAQALAGEGVNVVITARGEAALAATATELRTTHPAVEVRAVAGDITTPEGRAAALAACPRVDILGLSNGARSGLTGFVAGLARSAIAARGVTINGLLPGAFDTDRLRVTMQGLAQRSGQPVESVMAKRAGTIPAQRFGNAQEFGAVCAFLCSVNAGYLTGQNILLDGGAYPGTF